MTPKVFIHLTIYTLYCNGQQNLNTCGFCKHMMQDLFPLITNFTFLSHFCNCM